MSRATSADSHWTKWAYFCARVALELLLIAYKEPVTILNVFARYYRTGNIAPNSCEVWSRTVEDAVRLIGQAIRNSGGQRPMDDAYGEDRWEATTEVPLLLLSRPPSLPGKTYTITGTAPVGLLGRSLQWSGVAGRHRHDYNFLLIPSAARRVHRHKIWQLTLPSIICNVQCGLHVVWHCHHHW